MDFYNKCRGSFFRPGGFSLTKRAVEYCRFQKGSVIADIGCGSGETSRLIEEHFPIKVLNVEPSPPMSQGNPIIINACAESTTFENDMLDGALCECVLSLCDDIMAALNEMRRIIKHQGFLIISDVYSKTDHVKTSGAFKHLYTKKSYCSFVEHSGFEIILLEEHTRELAKMAARLIMEGRDCDADISGIHSVKDIGYFLLIAIKL